MASSVFSIVFETWAAYKTCQLPQYQGNMEADASFEKEEACQGKTWCPDRLVVHRDEERYKEKKRRRKDETNKYLPANLSRLVALATLSYWLH